MEDLEVVNVLLEMRNILGYSRMKDTYDGKFLLRKHI